MRGLAPLIVENIVLGVEDLVFTITVVEKFHEMVEILHVQGEILGSPMNAS